jgi:Raf kinase inhibitor-like YbhB/YbcL family protein
MIGSILGKILKNRRAGESNLVWNNHAVSTVPCTIQFSSPAILPSGAIPVRYAGPGVGENMSPPMQWSNIPLGTQEIVLVIEDPDAPLSKPFVHLIAVAIDPKLTGLGEGELSEATLPIMLGKGTFGRTGYSGPRALRAHGVHRYIFQIYAMSRKLVFSAPPTRRTLLDAFGESVIAKGCFWGTFERK